MKDVLLFLWHAQLWVWGIALTCWTIGTIRWIATGKGSAPFDC